MMAVIGTLSFNFQVLLPLMADVTWNGTASTYAALTAAMGVGSVAGALATGARGHISPALITGTAIAFGALQLMVAGAPSLELQFAVLVLLGASSVTFAAGVISALQLASEPAMQGRVMALFSMVYLGSTPIGGPLVGWLAEVAEPRAAMLPGGVAAIAVGVWARAAYAHAALPVDRSAGPGEPLIVLHAPEEPTTTIPTSPGDMIPASTDAPGAPPSSGAAADKTVSRPSGLN